MDVDLSKILQNDNKPAPLNLKKYINYILKKKIWILLIAIFFSVAAGTIVPVYLEKKKKYMTSSVIRFDDPRLSRGISALTDFSAGMETVSKASLFKSNSFIESVIDSLNLNLIILTPHVRRTRLFNSINIIPDVTYGTYKLKVQKQTCTVYFENPATDQIQLIKSFYDLPDSGIFLNTDGVKLHLNTAELKRFEEIEFVITSILMASIGVKEDLNYELDRTRTIMTIFYEHSDPEFSPYVTNKVTDMFIEKLLEYKRFQTRSILSTLDEQLKVAQIELYESEEELRKFREQNPNVFLSQGRELLINDLAEDQTQLENIKDIQNSINQMRQKLMNNKTVDSKQFVYLEIISFLEKQGVAGAELLSERYQTLITERERLKNENFNEYHPLVQNNETQIAQTQNEITGRLNEYQSQLKANSNNIQKNISSGQKTLRFLPRSELKLAELQRNRQIKENILSNIMVRYNEAKVTDAAVIPDAYIVDRAVIPIILPGGGIKEKIKYIGAGFIGGMGIGIILFVFLAFINKKIWNVKEIHDKINIPILALIPVIGNENSKAEFKNNETIDPKLITSDYAPTLAGETFRRLRTVMDMQLSNENKTIIIGSLFPGEGKSLISANLAIAFAQQKKKTILIDGDLRRGVQHSILAKNKEPGLTDLIMKSGNSDPLLTAHYIQDTHIPNLFLLTCGKQIPNPSELLGSSQMERIIQILESKFKCIIFDTPPFGLSPDLMVISKFSKNIILILKSGSTNLSEFKNNMDESGNIRKNLAGLIINSSDEILKAKYYQYSYYQY